MAPVYCRAVLAHDQRIALDGAPAETVDAEAKDLAAKQLARLAAREAAKKAAKAAAPAVVKPKHAPACATGCVQRCCAGTHSRTKQALGDRRAASCGSRRGSPCMIPVARKV